jgi:hypothetical protein
MHEQELERRAGQHLERFLRSVPVIELRELLAEQEVNASRRYDFMAKTLVHGQPVTMIVEVKRSGEPRHVRSAIEQLRSYQLDHRDAVPLVMAPYLSSQARSMCREMQVGYLDFEGNCHLVLSNVFIEREVAGKPVAERRAFKSIFRPRSALVLRALLSEPPRAWRLVELSQAAGVSLGQTSNVKSALLEREWATTTPDGLTLAQPRALLEAWREIYAPPALRKKRFYTPLHGRGLEDALPDALAAANSAGSAIMASFSAAGWIAPYARSSSSFLYADELAIESLTESLALTSPPKGENFIVTVLENDFGVLGDCIVAGEGILCTGAVQTYLDLWNAGERGREAAEYLRQETLKWSM